MLKGISRALLTSTMWANSAAATTQTAGGAETGTTGTGEQAGAQTAGATGAQSGQQAGTATAAGTGTAANGQTGNNAGQSTQTESQSTNAEPVTFTPEQQAALDKIVSDRLAEDRNKATRKQKKEGAQQAIKDGEADGDLQKALDGERTLRTDAETRVTELEGENKGLKRQIAVLTVATRYQLSPAIVNLLKSNESIVDEASAEAIAKPLATLKSTQQAPETDAGAGNRTEKKTAKTGNGSTANNSTNAQNSGDDDKLGTKYKNRGDVEWPS